MYLLNEKPWVTGSPKYGGLLQAVLKDGLESRTQCASDQVIDCLSYGVISSQRVLNNNNTDVHEKINRLMTYYHKQRHSLLIITSLLRSSKTSTNFAGNQPKKTKSVMGNTDGLLSVVETISENQI